MANFKTHLLVASAASSTLAVAAINLQLIDSADGPWFAFLGTLGGLLPDIDSNNSKPVRIVFNLLGLLGAAAVGVVLQHHFPLDRLLLLSIAVFCVVRYPLLAVFALFTEHRGIFHSLLSAVFFAFLTAYLSHYYLRWDAIHAWLNGLFIALGYVIHLCLDEIYSVDLANARIKRSFGSALKVCSLQNRTASLLMTAAILGLYFVAPSLTSLVTLWARIS